MDRLFASDDCVHNLNLQSPTNAGVRDCPPLDSRDLPLGRGMEDSNEGGHRVCDYGEGFRDESVFDRPGAKEYFTSLWCKDG